MRIWTKQCFSFLFLSLVLLAFSVGCSEPDDVDAHDVGVEEPDADAGPELDADAGPVEEPLERVAVDFDEAFDAPGEGFVGAIQVEDEADLIEGAVAQGRVGDWLLENDHGRYLVGLGERAVGPCSWDGNPIETELVEDGQRGESALGEICLLVNVGQTMRPEYAEIIEDGSEGRAVVAITGSIGALDFLNLRSMVNDLAPGLFDAIHFDPERSPPLTVTVYYVLTPESRSMRVLTAFRNDGEEIEHFVAAHLILSGSTGSYFTPLGGRKGWGYESLGVNNLSADPVSYIAYAARHEGYAFVPDPADHLEGRLPVGGGMLAISGVVAVLHGATDLLRLLTATEEQMETINGYIGIEPGEVETVGYRLYPSTGSISSVSDSIFADLGVETTTLLGQVVDHNGAPLEGIKVTPLEDGDRAFTMAWTDEDGRFSMNIPNGQWEIRARHNSRVSVRELEASGEEVDLGTMEMVEPAQVEVRVRTPEGAATPARVTVACADVCGIRRETSRELDPRFSPPLGWLEIIEVGVDGDATLLLAEGDYRISVNRGMTWTTWPQDANATGGELISVEPGDVMELDVEIAEVVDTTGLLSADFHIHAMASPDSSTGNRERVLDFLAGGLDVMVSSDHDAVSDFEPTIDALGATQHIASIVGNEITTSNVGHINAFPLERNPDSRRGGTLDWSRGGGFHLTLQEIIDATREHPGEQVVQLNHPRLPLGAIGLMKADVLTGQSFAERDLLRMPEADPDELTGDTGLWTDEFDALEVMNGFSMASFWGSFRWWLTMVGRGFSPTATAVSDTHGIYGSLAASPRSFVVVDEGMDSAATMDLDHFIDRIKSGALLGTNGPMMRVEVENEAGESAGMGDTLDGAGGDVTAIITLEMPQWVEVDTLDIYINIPSEELQGDPGESVAEYVAPTMTVPVVWDVDEHLELVAQGTLEHHRLRQTLEIPIEIIQDSYLVFVARGLTGVNMRPVVASGARPLAYSNPVFVDFDGGGYDNPPLMESREQRLEEQRVQGQLEGRAFVPEMIIWPGEALTHENVGRLLESLSCGHGEDVGEHVHGSSGDGHTHSHGDGGVHSH